MDSLAVTDHGNLHAAWSLLRGRQGRRDPPDPRLRGLPGLRLPAASARSPPAPPPSTRHLVLLAQNRTGYKNLIKLSLDRLHARGSTGGPGSTGGARRALGGDRLPRRLPLGRGGALAPPGQLRRGAPERRAGSPRPSGPTASGSRSRTTASPTSDLVTRRDAQARPATSGLGSSPPTTRTTCAGRTPRRTTSSSRSAPGRTSTTRSGSGSPGRRSTSSRKPRCARSFPTVRRRSRTPQRVADLCEFDFEKRYFLPQFPRPEGYATDDEPARSTSRRRGAAERYGVAAARARWPNGCDYELGVINDRGVRRVLPDRAGLHPRGARAGDPGRARAAARRPARSSPTPSASPTSIRSGSTCSSSGS